MDLKAKNQYTTFYVVRHGETTANVEGIIQGQKDYPLNSNGEEQAKTRARQLKSVKFDAIFSSDLVRAKRTAEIISLESKMNVLTTKALRRKEEGALFERMYEGMKTGLTMTGTTIAAVTVGYFVSSSTVIKEMFLIIIIGLLFDIIATYLNNAGLLMMYMRKKNE